MPSLNLFDRLIWFAHCPKAGGTSVEQLMVARWSDCIGHLQWGWDLWWRGGGWRLAHPPNSPQHLIWKDALEQLPKTPDVVFSVVRDPVARMASEHRWQRQTRRGTRAGKALSYLPFPLWLRVMLTASRINPYVFDNHFRRQSDFIPAHAHVFHLEAGLEPVVSWLVDQMGLETGFELIPHALPTGDARSIDPRDAALVAEVFALDYRRFGYKLPAKYPRRRILDGVACALAPVVAFLDRRGRL